MYSYINDNKVTCFVSFSPYYRTTFYIVDPTFPARMQTSISYPFPSALTADDVCLKLKPRRNETIGQYELLCNQPNIYFFIFSKTIPASRVSLSHFVAFKKVNVNTVLEQPPQKEQVIFSCTVSMVDQGVVESMVDEAVKLMEGLSLEKISLETSRKEGLQLLLGIKSELQCGNINAGELTLNRMIVHKITTCKLFDKDFHIGSQESSEACVAVTQFYSSREDLVIYNKKQFDCNTCSDEDVLRGSVGEINFVYIVFFGTCLV